MQRPTVDFISRKFRPKPKSDGRSRSRSEDLVVGFQWPRVYPARVVFHATALVAAGRHQIVYTWNVLRLPLPPPSPSLRRGRASSKEQLNVQCVLQYSTVCMYCGKKIRDSLGFYVLKNIQLQLN